jgi:DNA-binding beta-propeller fold protein YncE
MPMKLGKNGNTSCPECEFTPFARNHYFTGKLLVERDFRDEQRYYVDKLRLHEHRLHGSGVVCGLKVKQSPTKECQSRFVCIEPGLAIDCCGREVIVTEEDCTVDLTRLDSMKPIFARPNDPTSYNLQICIRYKECPTEQIPVLYDDCGCDGTQCAPNRILESYAIDVIVNPDLSKPSPSAPNLSRNETYGVAHAAFAVVDDNFKSLYVVDASNAATLTQFSTDNQVLLASRAIGGVAQSMAVSEDGKRVYIVVAPQPAGPDYRLLVIDTTQAGLPAVQNNPIPIPNSANNPFQIVFSSDGHLYGLNGHSGDIIRWNVDIDTQPNAATPAPLLNVNPAPSFFAISHDGKTLFTVDGADVQSVDLTAAAPAATKLVLNPPIAAPSAIGMVNSSAGDLLAVADKTNQKLYLVDPAALNQVKGPVALNHAPIAVLVAPDGRWAYVVEADPQHGYVTAVDFGNLRDGKAVVPGPELTLGLGTENPVLNSTGTALYVPYTGAANVATDGGVAVVTIEETDCCGLLWRSAEECVDCGKGDCIVLATILNYVAGASILDPTDPPSDPKIDLQNKIARLDNKSWRRILPSTSSMAEAIKCLCESGGTKGVQGDPGPAGKDGAGIDDVAVTFVPCDTVLPKPTIVPGPDNTHILNLTIPGCCDTGLTHICGINWKHGGTVTQAELFDLGLVVTFDGTISAADVHSESVKLFAPIAGQNRVTWVESTLKLLKAVHVNTKMQANGTCNPQGSPENVAPGKPANGIQIVAAQVGGFSITHFFRLVIDGDFISSTDAKGKVRAVDIDHLPPWLSFDPVQKVMTGRLTGDGIEGGPFVSYFKLQG